VNAKDRIQLRKWRYPIGQLAGLLHQKLSQVSAQEETSGKERGRRLSREIEGNVAVNATVPQSFVRCYNSCESTVGADGDTDTSPRNCKRITHQPPS
jgi:hypothetical protein